MRIGASVEQQAHRILDISPGGFGGSGMVENGPALGIPHNGLARLCGKPVPHIEELVPRGARENFSR
jgi:hypothetical protein